MFQQQKCWECAKATGSFGGCSWCKNFVPVKGWTAMPTLISGNLNYQSFDIEQCPEFIEDSYIAYGNIMNHLRDAPKDKSKPFYMDNAIRMICTAMRQAVDEYLCSSNDIYKEGVIKEIRNMDVYGITDSNMIIAELQRIEGRMHDN